MHRELLAALAMLAGATMLAPAPATAEQRGLHEVVGVEDGDMLKMRAGPGTGYKIVLGLPNGTLLRVHDCDQTGSTRWCKVSLQAARGLKGFVSATYLRER